MKHCINCGTLLQGNYCHKCGQKEGNKRILGKDLYEEVIHFFTHVEHGFLYTSKELLIRPGKAMHAYLNGHRKKFQSPVSYIAIWVGLEWLVRKAVIYLFQYKFIVSPFETNKYGDIRSYYYENSYWLFLIIAPVVGSIIYLLLGKPRYNIFEMTVFAFYGIGSYYILQLFFSTILLGLFFRVNIRSWKINTYYSILAMFWTFRFIYDYFRTIKLKLFWFRMIICGLLVSLVENVITLYLPLLLLKIFET